MEKNDSQRLLELREEFRSRGIPFVDRHTHSLNKYSENFPFLPHPQGPYTDTVALAERISLEEFAITDHSYEIFLEPQMEERTILQNKFQDGLYGQYLQYLDAVKSRYPALRVLGGIELKIRDMQDLDSFDPSELSKLDIVLIETLMKRPDFARIRNYLGNGTRLILAHPDPEYLFQEDSSPARIDEWIDSMATNDISFDINRQFLKKFISGGEVYDYFFRSATDKGLLFSIGSDYHVLGNYAIFFENILKMADKYNLRGKDFVPVQNDSEGNE